MNPLYDQLFNQQYVSQAYADQLKVNQHAIEQQKEISNAVKAIKDYMRAVKKIEPMYQQDAFNACVLAILEELNKCK